MKGDSYFRNRVERSTAWIVDGYDSYISEFFSSIIIRLLCSWSNELG